jgi:FKBP-type peptidyl-prolyl cis-trans isomerase SlyD
MLNQEDITVSDNIAVSMEYKLRIDDEGVIDQSEDNKPLEFIQGSGQIIPGLEKEIYGMTVGEEKEVVIEPDNGYGEYDPEDVEKVSRSVFPADLELEEGLSLWMRDPESGESYQATVVNIHPDTVVLDFNHPLAGETLYFHVKIVDLRPATREEIAHGHIHGSDSEH